MNQKLTVALIPGDGIGPEVTASAVEVMRRVCQGEVELDFHSCQLGAERFLRTGEILPPQEFAQIKQADAILLGAIGGEKNDPRLQAAQLERNILLRLRMELDHGVIVRPVKSYLPGPLKAGEDIDFLVIREGTEGAYAGVGGSIKTGTPEQIASEVSVNTYQGVHRVLRFAYEQAQNLGRPLTLVHKTNVLVYAGQLWNGIFRDLASDYPTVATDYLHIDAATMEMVERPQRFGVIVTDNLFGDILTDLAGAVAGGIGLAASANLNLAGDFPSMFEPVHGSAPDIAGKNLADPRAAMLSAGLLLSFCGHEALGQRIEQAVAASVAAGPAGTAQITEAVLAGL